MKNNEHTEGTKQGTTILDGFSPIEIVPTVNIPLDEYKAFIEFQVKGPIAEIPLQEYNELKENNMRMQEEIFYLKDKIKNLEHELEKRDTIADILNKVWKAAENDIHSAKWDIIHKIESAATNVSDSVIKDS